MATGRDNQKSFFGRRKGKTLRPKQRQAVDDVLPLYRIDISDPTPADAAGLFEADVDRVRLEIGFGGGEHFLHRAAEQPETGFIGVEPFVNGMAKCAAALAEEPLRNVRLFDEEAALLLDWLPEGSVDHIDLLYPDPWPKKRHWKRRFVNEESLDRLARVLKPGGVFCFASDIDTYVNWTLLHCRHHPAFAWQAEAAQDWRRPYPGWPGTRYEAKAVREGRTPAYLTFRRV